MAVYPTTSAIIGGDTTTARQADTGTHIPARQFIYFLIVPGSNPTREFPPTFTSERKWKRKGGFKKIRLLGRKALRIAFELET